MAHPPKIPALSPEELGAKVAGGHIDALRKESENITAKIDAAYEKLASKLRTKADKAKEALETKKDARKRALLLRRFELYADAATDIEMRLTDRRGVGSADSD